MFELKITTTVNEINIVVEDLESKEVKEILSQPYIVKVEPKIYTGDIEKAKVLKKVPRGGI